jgi:uncharacterized damage-inducible protein DinB
MAAKTAQKKGKSAAKRPAPNKAARKPVAKSPSPGRSPKSARQQFLDSFKREHECTMKVLRAFPQDQVSFRPHPRSNSVKDLAFTFVMEQRLISLAMRDELKLGGGAPKAPEEFNAIVEQFERDYVELVRLIEKLPADKLDGTVTFPLGPGKIGDWNKMDFSWFMLHDQIHHRGQLSVYLRMIGGKVPAIYGPSSDEPWF